ncbi:DUF503 domain-containing protein [Facklamia sp. DSM 111018]|uniref:DUF503 domain-containing protein n=1 Tax=Facklamia lactis TaxID=2749967 RepID=A0ABS0LMQ7_9LACT|nr:DUF503 domain-containing protein [Facklamia lactis]MBG9979875.1 DUF503 domain-containing protein [Facklamia lactis]MBG9985445.1 DUF503 domain-containing protein [Facklamia lactis]
MYILALKIEIKIYLSNSLKDKRKIIKKITHHIRHRFPITVSEIDHLDLLNYSTIGIAMVGNDKVYLDQVKQKVINELDQFFEFEIIEITNYLELY